MSQAAKKTTRRRKKVEPKDSTPVAAAAPAESAASASSDANVLFVQDLPVRWRDLDAFNHVNNAAFLTYLEEARLFWLESLPGPWVSDHSAPVLAAATVNYRRPIGWPETLRITLSCERLGRSSITIGHRITAASDASVLYSDGQVVMVWVDARSGKAAALPAAVREAGS